MEPKAKTGVRTGEHQHAEGSTARTVGLGGLKPCALTRFANEPWMYPRPAHLLLLCLPFVSALHLDKKDADTLQVPSLFCARHEGALSCHGQRKKVADRHKCSQTFNNTGSPVQFCIPQQQNII